MTTHELLRRHGALWREAVAHPFLDGVRDGSLPLPAFRAWLTQDYLFVAGELRFQAGLLRIAPRRAQAVLAAGLSALEAELSWFEAQAERLAVRLESEPLPVTDRYREHLEATLSAGWAPAITTLWALELAYLEAWRGAAPGGGPYTEFVDHWTPPEFAGYVEGLASAVGEDGDEAAFRKTAELERDFWEMAWRHA